MVRERPTALNCVPWKLSFKNEGKKTFLDKQKFREFVVNRLALQEMLLMLLNCGVVEDSCGLQGDPTSPF